MPRKRLSMRQVHEVLRLKWAVGLSDRQIARSLGLSRPTVAAYVQRAQVAGLSWPLPDGLDAATLEQRLFPPSPATAPVTRPGPRLGHGAPRTQTQGRHLVPAVAGIQGHHA